MKLSANANILRVIRLAFFKNEPIVLEYSYISKILYQYIKDKRKMFSSNYIYSIFKEIPKVLLVKSKISIKAMLATEFQAKKMKIDTGEPVLILERTSFSKGREIAEFTKFVVRGDKFSNYLEFSK